MPLYAPDNLVQTVSAKVTTDQSTTSASFVDLLTLTFTKTTSDSVIIVMCAFSGNSSTSGNDAAGVRSQMDSTALSGSGLSTAKTPVQASCVLNDRVTGLAAGSHTVHLQWQGSLNCQPVTNPNYESASILVQEVLV